MDKAPECEVCKGRHGYTEADCEAAEDYSPEERREIARGAELDTYAGAEFDKVAGRHVAELVGAVTDVLEDCASFTDTFDVEDHGAPDRFDYAGALRALETLRELAVIGATR